MDTIDLDGHNLSLEEVERIARGEARVKLADKGREQLKASRSVVEDKLKSGEVAYGINTGFGHLSNIRIEDKDVDQLQLNLIRSHATALGEPLDEATVRAAMLLRANTLAKGYSGVREVVVELLLDLINNGVHPVIPSQGSVGASGDLAPLAHLALVLVGEGEALYRGKAMSGAQALQKAGLKPLTLKAKEGLSLINGCQITAAIGALTLLQAERCCQIADIAGALTLEALKGSKKPFDERIHYTRPHPGQLLVARNLTRLLQGSEIMESHKFCSKIQDAYSLRCMPQVHGAVRDALSFVRSTVAREINSATDNPMIFVETKEILSGGNFHGEILALAMDFMAMALTELGNISERRIMRLMDPKLSELPPFLIEKAGLHSGFMLVQVTAASLASENKPLSHPASVDTIPTSANQEDHVSMSTTAARKASMILKNIEKILAIELLCAAQGMEFHRPLKSSAALEEVHKAIRRQVSFLKEDRELHKDINSLLAVMREGIFISSVKKSIGSID
jgi:histidine ammonia-lyase